MRTMILAAAASVVALATLGTAPSHAVGVRYPFCIQGDRYPGLSNCSYPSYEACLATASGMTFLGLGAAFWGIVIGLAANGILHGRASTRQHHQP